MFDLVKLLGKIKKKPEENERTVDLPFNFFSTNLRANPYPYYRELRERAPVHYFKDHQFWTVSRYSDVVMALKRIDLFSSVQNESRLNALVSMDPPEHTRWRAILSDLFAEHRIPALEENIRNCSNRFIARMQARGRTELMSDFASPIAILSIMGILDIDESHYGDIQRWATDWILEHRTPETKRQFKKSFNELHEFFVQYVDACERHRIKGFINALLHSNSDKERITHEEAIDLGKLLLLAGSLTTTHLIGNSCLALLRHPEEMKIVVSNLNLIPAVIEETLRYDPPAQILPRTIVKDVEIAGVNLPAGDTLQLVLGSANRDEKQFPDPDRFFIQRNARHIAFGSGIHFCLGARLGRLEARIALETLLSRFPRLQAAEPLERIEYLDSFTIRGIKKLNMTLG